MHPVFKVSQLSELWHFEFLCQLDFVWVVFEGSHQPSGHDFTVVSYPDDLCFEEVLFLSREGRR